MELSITTSYVKSWTVKDAIRELLQNAIDSEDYSYNEYQIINAGAITPQDFLLGQSTKQDGGYIGQFGEGLKLALLVLARNNVTVSVTSYPYCYTPSIRWSDNFQAEVLHIDITECTVPGPVAVTFAEPQEMEGLYTPDRGILLDNPKLYVGGLYICDLPKFKHGYSLPTGAVNLERDRKTVSDWDLSWEASRLWSQAADAEQAVALAKDPDYQDCTLLHHFAQPRHLAIVERTAVQGGRYPSSYAQMVARVNPPPSDSKKQLIAWATANKQHFTRSKAKQAINELIDSWKY